MNTKTTLPDNFVYISKLCPSIRQDIKYSSTDNFTGNIVCGYNRNAAILTEKAALSLSNVQHELESKNQSLLIWDAYRPTSAVSFFLKWESKEDNITSTRHKNILDF